MRTIYAAVLISIILFATSVATTNADCPARMPKYVHFNDSNTLNHIPAVTSHECHELVGTVIKDKKIPFEFRPPNPTYWYKGVIYSRVIRSKQTGELHFYYAVQFDDVSETMRDQFLRSITLWTFSGEKGTWLGYRTDGIGAKDWDDAHWVLETNYVLEICAFWQPRPGMNLTQKCLYYRPGQRSRFVVVKTTAKEFREDGDIQLESWNAGDQSRHTGVCVPKY